MNFSHKSADRRYSRGDILYRLVMEMDAFVKGGFSALSIAILQTAAYADIFDYPLTSGEIHRYLIGCHAPGEAVENFLHETSLLSNVQGYYTLPGRELLVPIRRRREKISSELWPRAIYYGRIIARLPFVRMVAVTGALALNNVGEGADIDYMVVTDTGRLWSSRGLILLFGRLARRKGAVLCPNYLVSLHNLDFADQTLYTAHEIAQMVPLAGSNVYDQIRKQNDWVERFLPNAAGAPAVSQMTAQSVPHALARPALETLLRTAPFSSLERWEMNRKMNRLWREQRYSAESDFSENVCKGHKHGHQSRTHSAMAERLTNLERELKL